MHSDFITSIAYHQPTETVKHVKEVANGLACDCICKDCKGRLEAVQPKTTRKWHFRHYSKSDCKGNCESLLHKYAKQVIVQARSIVRKKDYDIKYVNAVAEATIDPFRPDVTLNLGNEEKVYIEVFVSNSVKEIKRDYFIVNQLKSFEIDLSRISERNKLVDMDELKKEILENHRNRESLYWPEEIAVRESSNSIWPLLIAIGLFIYFIITFKFLRSKKRRKRF